MILILTDPTDTHADHLAALLDARGTPYVRIDPAWFPQRASLSVHFGPSGLTRREIHVDGTVIDLAEVIAVWVRRPRAPVPDDRVGPEAARTIVATETGTVVADLWDTLEVRHVPAPRPVVQRAQHKLRQLQLAGRLGFELPPTLVTNSPEAVLDFAAGGGPLITKLAGLTPLGTDDAGSPLSRFTEPLRSNDLLAVDDVALCPVIVQARVPKRLELRVTVVGEVVFAAAIHSQQTNHSRYDWRRHDDAQIRIADYALPDEVADRCVALTRSLGLCYGAIDLVLTPDGRYVFLEINPSGQYLWIELATGLPITAAIADLLTPSLVRS